MTKFIDPVTLGLQSRTTLEEINPDTLAIVINRKSRIIMADGRKIHAKAIKIIEARPGWKVMLKTSAPVCSKTLQYLAGLGIEVVKG